MIYKICIHIEKSLILGYDLLVFDTVLKIAEIRRKIAEIRRKSPHFGTLKTYHVGCFIPFRFVSSVCRSTVSLVCSFRCRFTSFHSDFTRIFDVRPSKTPFFMKTLDPPENRRKIGCFQRRRPRFPLEKGSENSVFAGFLTFFTWFLGSCAVSVLMWSAYGYVRVCRVAWARPFTPFLVVWLNHRHTEKNRGSGKKY